MKSPRGTSLVSRGASGVQCYARSRDHQTWTWWSPSSPWSHGSWPRPAETSTAFHLRTFLKIFQILQKERFNSWTACLMCAFFFLWKKDFTLWTSSAEVPGGPGVTFGLTAASFLNLSTSLWKAMSRGTSRGFLGKYFFLNLHKLQTLEPSILKDDEGTLLRWEGGVESEAPLWAHHYWYWTHKDIQSNIWKHSHFPLKVESWNKDNWGNHATATFTFC